MTDPVEIRGYRPGDEHSLLAAYNKVFPTPDGKIQPRSMAHWLWKYRDNPTGQIHVAIANHRELGAVGCYATMPLRVWIEGEQKICGHVIDLFVLPEWRRHGARPGLFVHCGLEHYKIYGGTGPGQMEFSYGWPVPNWRIGKKYLSYENIRDWDFLFRQVPPGGIPLRASSAELEVREVARYGADADALWEQEKKSLTMALVRDSIYLNWRYADAHDRKYRLFECREKATGKLRGLCVYTRCDFLFPNTAFLVDWLCPLDDEATMVSMVAAIEQVASAEGANVLATLFPQLDPRFLKFQHLGFLVYGTGYFLVVAPIVDRGTLFYREHWYHTCGDSDLV